MTTAMTATFESESTPAAGVPGKKALWTGRILSGLAVLFLTMDAMMKVLNLIPEGKHGSELGWTLEQVRPLGWLQLVCLALYLVPRTSVLGAILWTGYLGGAIATHLRVDNPLFSHVLFPVYVGGFLWLGLYLRDARLRALVPFSR